MAEMNMIHESDIYFDVVEPMVGKYPSGEQMPERMHHGEIYIYLNRMYLHDGKRWYKAKIEDIKDIETVIAQKKILIHFWNYDIVLFCSKYSHLLALRDFLFLLNNNSGSPDNKHSGSKTSEILRFIEKEMEPEVFNFPEHLMHF